MLPRLDYLVTTTNNVNRQKKGVRQSSGVSGVSGVGAVWYPRRDMYKLIFNTIYQASFGYDCDDDEIIDECHSIIEDTNVF